MNNYRNGPIGALMDEYERAAEELMAVLLAIPDDVFITLMDPDAADPDCRSVQTVMNHIMRAGYGYANYIRQQFGNAWEERKPSYDTSNHADAIRELQEMLTYTVESLEDKWDITAEAAMKNIIHASWGQDFDMEQLLEHAIVHILRHRRQIERWRDPNG